MASENKATTAPFGHGIWTDVVLRIFRQEIQASLFVSSLLTISWRRPLSYRNQSIDLQSKSVDWFLYDNGLRHERVKLGDELIARLKLIKNLDQVCLFSSLIIILFQLWGFWDGVSSAGAALIFTRFKMPIYWGMSKLPLENSKDSYLYFWDWFFFFHCLTFFASILFFTQFLMLSRQT